MAFASGWTPRDCVLNLHTGEQIAEFGIELQEMILARPERRRLVALIRPPFDRQTRWPTRPARPLEPHDGKITSWKWRAALKREGQADYTEDDHGPHRRGRDALIATTIYAQLAATNHGSTTSIERFEHCEDEWDVSVEPPQHIEIFASR